MTLPVAGVRRDGSRVSNGSNEDLRLGGYGEQLVNDIGHGRYYEAVRLGKVFTTTVKAVTVAATHNSPIAANTATPVVGLANTSTNRVAVLIRAALLTTSGTPAGGQAVLNLQPGGAGVITASATGSIFNHDGRAGASPQGSAMKPYNNVALAGWLATPNAVQEMMLLGGASAAAAAGNGGPGMGGEDLGGLIQVVPGALLALMCGSGAGTSWIVNASLTWIELDYPS